MKRLTLWIVSVALGAIAGCGGGTATPALSGGALDQGRAALERMASGQETPTLQSLQTASQRFEQALQSEPNRNEARFGLAVATTASVAMLADGAVELPPPPPGSGTGIFLAGERPPAPPNQTELPAPALPHRYYGFLWNLDRGLTNPLSLLRVLAPVANLHYGLVPLRGYQQDFATRRKEMLERLDRVSEQLTALENEANFTATLPTQDGSRLVIGMPEVRLFHAYIHSLRTEMALSLAYVREADPQWKRVRPPSRLDANADGKLTASEYLPASPFLTLREGGYLAKAREAMRGVVTHGTLGAEGVLARPADDKSFLVPNTAELRAALTELRDTVLPLIQQATTGAVTIKLPRYDPTPLMGVPGGANPPITPLGDRLFTLFTDDAPPPPPVMQEITINLAAWFAAPPTDLKTFAPIYTLGANGWTDLSQTVYPDSTFGGLFPGGLPRIFWL